MGLALCVLGLCHAARAQGVYLLDQTNGAISFSVGSLGLFRSEGEFKRFTARLTIDPAHPEATVIDVTIDAGSASMGWSKTLAMLRSPDYLDVAAYPTIRFRSTAVTRSGADGCDIDGMLQMRGVTRPQVFHAAVTERHADAGGKGEVADFLATGELPRRAFGMVADGGLVSATVRLRIRARIAIPSG